MSDEWNVEEGSKKDGIKLSERFENRCPVMLFSQMLGFGAGLVSRRDAYKFLQQRDWDSESIIKILDSISIDDEQNVKKEDLIRSSVAIMCKDGSRRSLADAIAISSCSSECILQFQGTLIPTSSAPKMEMWHQQVCCHLGLKGFVRLCYTGIILDVGLVLQGHEDDVVAYIDGLLAPNITGNGDSLMIPFRRLSPGETRLSELTIVTHADKEEMIDGHASDLAAIDHVASTYSLKVDPHVHHGNTLMEPTAHELSAEVHAERFALSAASESAYLLVHDDEAIELCFETPAKELIQVRTTGHATPKGTTAVCLFDYLAIEHDELSIKCGEVLQVKAKHADGWYLVQNVDGGFGVVPGNYLRIMDARSREERKARTGLDPKRSPDDTQEVNAFLKEGIESVSSLEVRLNSVATTLQSSWLSNHGNALKNHMYSCRRGLSAAKYSLREMYSILQTEKATKSESSSSSERSKPSGVLETSQTENRRPEATLMESAGEESSSSDESGWMRR
eukprot:767726-Hanusia_phi.AAC.1